MNDFNGKGTPLEDDRLTLSGTTPAGEQQYRIWHDGQMILVPRGQSTTKPLQPENVSCNTGVFSTIGQGYFKPPIVEFRNTVDYRLFDRYWLQTFRYEIPSAVNIDWHVDLSLKAVWLDYKISFKCNGIKGHSQGTTIVYYKDTKNWCTDVLHFEHFGLKHLKGDFILVTNPTAEQLEQGKEFNTGKFLQPVNLPVSAIVQNASYHDGNSEMELLIKNLHYVLELDEFEFTLLGGE